MIFISLLNGTEIVSSATIPYGESYLIKCDNQLEVRIRNMYSLYIDDQNNTSPSISEAIKKSCNE